MKFTLEFWVLGAHQFFEVIPSNQGFLWLVGKLKLMP